MNKTISESAQKAVTKVDLRQQLKYLYNPSAKEATIVTVPDMQFLMVDGTGNPNTSQAYQEAVEALYGVSYALKFMIKKEQAIDYPVMALEGLWWTEDMQTFSTDNKENWQWTMMIMRPEQVTAQLFEQARKQVKRKKDSPALAHMRLQNLHEGEAAQIMHLGPFSAEGPTIARLHAFIQEQGYRFDDGEQKHHEIYLSDPRRTAPDKMKTVIRQPVTGITTAT
jgi:hypothetical protein